MKMGTMFKLRSFLMKIATFFIALTVSLSLMNTFCLASVSSYLEWYDSQEEILVDVYSVGICLNDLEPSALLFVGLETYESFNNNQLSSILLDLDTDFNSLTGWPDYSGLIGADYGVFIYYEGDGLVGELYKNYTDEDCELIGEVGVLHDDGNEVILIYFPWEWLNHATSFRWNLSVNSLDAYSYEYWDFVPDLAYEIWRLEGLNIAEFIIGQSSYILNGVTTTMDAASYIKNSRTYIPVRYLAYSLGVDEGDIGWDSGTRTVTLIKEDTTVILTIGSKILKMNGVSSTMDVAPEISGGRTMLPARWVAEAFFANTIGWDSGLKTVTITY